MQQRTAEHWARPREGEYGPVWTDLISVQKRLNCKVSGVEHEDWITFTLRTYFEGKLPLAECYSLCCGHGAVERQLARMGAFVQCVASDISRPALTVARALAAAEGINSIVYEVSDANFLSLAPQRYDAVWSHAAVHHLGKLEHVFSEVASALKPGGLFILHEYVGPNRFQFDAYQRGVIQSCLSLLPADYRQVAPGILRGRRIGNAHGSLVWLAKRVVDKLRDGDLLAAVERQVRMLSASKAGRPYEKKSVDLPFESSVIAVDPSEAVRSAEIVPALQCFFDVLAYKPLGGTILHFLLADIAGCFEREAEGQRMLDMLFGIEDTLINTGHLQSDFAYIVARPKASR